MSDGYPYKFTGSEPKIAYEVSEFGTGAVLQVVPGEVYVLEHPIVREEGWEWAGDGPAPTADAVVPEVPTEPQEPTGDNSPPTATSDTPADPVNPADAA